MVPINGEILERLAIPVFQRQNSRKPSPQTLDIVLPSSTIMSAKLALSDVLSLSNSAVKIPRLGFGVYQSPTSVCIQSCLAALAAGYRHIDSAQFYANEYEVGEAVRQSKLPRKDIFVTTKIMRGGGSPEKTYQKALESVKKINLDGYVDLFLIHTASGGKAARKEMWQALEQLHSEGKARSIGVSNFGVGHIEEMKEYAKIWPPHVNQIEVSFIQSRVQVDADPLFVQLHPWCQQRTIDSYCQQHGIVVEAYSPLVRNRKANDPTLASLATKYKTSSQQLLIRYCLQKGWVPLPKSDTPARIESNADVYGFEIDQSDMKKLDNLDEGARGAIGRHPTLRLGAYTDFE